MLFCRPVKRRPTAKELFEIVDDFVKEKSIKWPDGVGVCMDAARAVAGNKEDCKPELNDQHQKPCGHTVWYIVNHWLRKNYAQN
jgi:hypothetical protein